jgi:hypothetical protein
LVYSVDRIAAREANKQLNCVLPLPLLGNGNANISEMCGYVCVRMALAVVRANTLLLRGSRVRQPQHCPVITNGVSMEGVLM